MHILLSVICLLLVVVGFMFLSEATMGVGILAVAAIAGILARLAQASAYKDALDKKLDAILKMQRSE